MGKVGTRFGRNAPPDATAPERDAAADEPEPARGLADGCSTATASSPRRASTCSPPAGSSSRTTTGSATARTSPTSSSTCPLAEGDDWPDGDPMKVKAHAAPTARAPGRAGCRRPTSTRSPTGGTARRSTARPRSETASCAPARTARWRSRTAGCRTRPSPNLDGVDLTGFTDNYWIGLSLLHTLFVKEHNAICDHLKRRIPGLGRRAAVPHRAARQLGADGEDPHGRVDAGDPRQPGARAGDARRTGTASLPRWVRRPVRPPRHRDDRRDRGLAAGAPRGAVLDHRGVRLGLPAASAAPRRLRDPRPPQRRARSRRPTSSRSRATARGRRSTKYGLVEPLLLVRGRATRARSRSTTTRGRCSNHVRLTGDRVDLGTIDVLRDRERGVRRYNDFREALRKRRIEKFEDLTDNAEWASRDPRRLRRRHRPGRPPGRACSPSRCRRASGSATPRSGSSS